MKVLKIAEYLIGNLDNDGYLRREIKQIVDDLAFSQGIYTIEEKVKDILKKYRNLEQKKDWKNQKLLGNDLKFSARDLINVYVELEKEFDIHFKEKDIVAGKFDTFDDIIKLINKEIAYKTRGKEHA